MLPKIFVPILFIIISLIPSVISAEDELPIVKCDRESKVKDVCGIVTVETMLKDGSQIKGNILNLKDNCKKNEICSKMDEDSTFYICKKKLNYLYTGDDCTFNLDCYSEECGGNTCQTAGSGQVCKNNWTCEPGYFCKDQGENNKCNPLVQGDIECSDEDFCEPGYICDPVNRKCTKIGSLKESLDTTNKFYCQSGLMYDGKCIGVIRDGECKKGGTDEKYTCTPDVTGYSGTVTVNCISYDDDPICPISLLKTDLFRKYIEFLEKVDMEEFAKKDKHRITEENKYYLDDGNTYKAYIKYLYMEYLRAMGVLNSEGDVDKKCEFEYYLKSLDSSYLKFSKLIFGILLLTLL